MTKLGHQLFEVIRFVNFHGTKISIRLVQVGQIQNGARMAAIHDANQMHTFGEWLDEDIVQVIVTDLSVGIVIQRDEGFIVTVIFFAAVVVTDLTPVTGVVTEKGVTRLRRRHQVAVGLDHVLARGVGVTLGIEEDSNVALVEFVDILNVLQHVLYIVVTATQLSLLVVRVIDPNEQGAARPRRFLGDQIEGFVHVNLQAGRKLPLR